MASGASGASVKTVVPTVQTRKNVPINSVAYFTKNASSDMVARYRDRPESTIRSHLSRSTIRRSYC